MAERNCAVPNCTNTGQTRRGMCDMHYRRWRRNGVAGPPGALRIIGNDLARFQASVNRQGPTPDRVAWLGPCWVWTGHTDTKGYGHFKVGGKVIRCHLWVYRVLVGPVPDGLELDHLCRNTSCVRLSHLEPVTKAENVRRRNLALAGKAWLAAS